MKKFLFPFFGGLTLLFSSCEIDTIERPKDLIPQEKMVKVLEDVILMKSIRSNFGGEIKYDSIFGMEFIYTKHNITEEQLLNSEQYYAKRPKEYVIMHKRVLLRLQQMSDSIDAVIKSEKDEAVKRGEK